MSKPLPGAKRTLSATPLARLSAPRPAIAVACPAYSNTGTGSRKAPSSDPVWAERAAGVVAQSRGEAHSAGRSPMATRAPARDADRRCAGCWHGPAARRRGFDTVDLAHDGARIAMLH